MKYVQIDSENNIVGVSTQKQDYAAKNIEVEDKFDVSGLIYDGKNFVPDIGSLKTKKRQKIKDLYETERTAPSGGFFSEVLGKQINGGMKQYEDISALAAAGDNYCKTFKIYDNSFVNVDSEGNMLTAETFRQICIEMTAYTAECFFIKENKLSALDACTTIEEIEAIKI